MTSFDSPDYDLLDTDAVEDENDDVMPCPQCHSLVVLSDFDGEPEIECRYCGWQWKKER